MTATRDPGWLPHLPPLPGIFDRFDGVLRDAKKEPAKDTPKETPKAAPKATEADAARATKKPTAAQVREINGHLERARKAGEIADQAHRDIEVKEAQKAIDLVVKYYGIDTSNVNGNVTFDWKDATQGAQTDRDRHVLISSPALVDAPNLAATVVHETTHANQIKQHGWYSSGPTDPAKGQSYAAREIMGYQAALSSADNLGLDDKTKKWYAEHVESNKSFLSKDNLKLYESGQYWGMKPGQAGD